MIANHDATALSAFAFAMTVAPYVPYPPPATLEGIATGGGAARGFDNQTTRVEGSNGMLRGEMGGVT